MVRVPYNRPLTNLASPSRTGEYWPSVVFVRTERSEVRTATTSGEYSPVRPSRSGSKRLILFSVSSVFFCFRYTHEKNRKRIGREGYVEAACTAALTVRLRTVDEIKGLTWVLVLVQEKLNSSVPPAQQPLLVLENKGT